MDSEPTPGTRVRFTVNRLGAVDPTQYVTRFREEVVNCDDEGEVVTGEGHTPIGWVMVKPDKYPALLVPVHPAMIEPLRSQERA